MGIKEFDEWLEKVKKDEKGSTVMAFEMTLIKIGDWEWSDDYSYLRTLTCVNHPTARYLTKNPFYRSLMIVALPTDEGIERTATGECTCPFEDLRVIKESSQNYRRESGK